MVIHVSEIVKTLHVEWFVCGYSAIDLWHPIGEFKIDDEDELVSTIERFIDARQKDGITFPLSLRIEGKLSYNIEQILRSMVFSLFVSR